MVAILFALISYFGWGTADVFGTIATRKIGGYNSTFYIYLIQFLISSLYLPFALADLSKFNLETIILTIVLGILTPFSLLFFYEGLKLGNAPLIGSIVSSWVAVSLFLALIFLGETITLNQFLAVCLILLGIALSSLDFKQIKLGKFFSDPGIPYAVLAMVLWGIYFAFIKIPIQQVGWFWPGYFSVISFPAVLIYMKLKKVKLIIPNTLTLKMLTMSALLIIMGGFSYNLAIERGLIVLVAPIAGSAVTLFAFLAYLIFKDPITKQQVIGIITTIFGIVLLSFLSV